MPWFKVDDALYGHPKWLAATPHARALWVSAGSWCSAHLTDGMVPRHVLPTLGGRTRDAAELVRVGLWSTVEDGWAFHGWLEMQPSREAVVADRRSGAARQKVARSPELRAVVRERDADRCRYCGERVRWSDRRGPLGGTYDHVVPDGPSDVDNLVVACRGCNASKGRRTPDEAGMVLLPEPNSGSRSRVRSEPDTASSPTRPDPTRPSLVTSSAAAATSPDDRKRRLDEAAAVIGERAAQRPGVENPAAVARAVARAVITDRRQDAYRALVNDPTMSAVDLAEHLEPTAQRMVLPPAHIDETIADLTPPASPRIAADAADLGRSTIAALKHRTTEDA